MFGRKHKQNRANDTFTWTSAPLPAIETFAVLANGFVLIANPALSKPTVTNPTEYDQLLQDKAVNPKAIKRIRLITDNISQLAEPFIWNYTDSNGEAQTFSDQPLNMLSPDQFQSRVIDIDYKKLIIGNNEFFTWRVLPSTTVRLTFVYDDYKLHNLLNEKEFLIKK